MVVKKIEFARKKGADETKSKADARFKIAKQIFEKLQLEGERLPIKKAAIYSTFLKYWDKSLRLKLPKEDTLYDYQKKFLGKK
jgi:hypothetical protein